METVVLSEFCFVVGELSVGRFNYLAFDFAFGVLFN